MSSALRVKLHTKRFFMCPNGCASKEFFVEHLMTGKVERAGPWYCEEEMEGGNGACGQGWMVNVNPAGDVDVTPHVGDSHYGLDGKMRRPLLILEIPPQEQSIRFLVRGRQFAPEPDLDNWRYYYEEHTCPTNWLKKDVEEVLIDGRKDPHGLARFVGMVEGKRT